MPNPLFGSLASSIYSAFNTTLAYDVTLHSVTESEAASGSITESEDNVATRGLIVEWDNTYKFEGKVPDGARRCIIFQDSTSTTPKRQDRVTPTQGPYTGQKMLVHEVSADPAGAIWDLMLVPWSPP